MKEKEEYPYVKRTQKDWNMAFKLGVVQEVGSGKLGIKAAARKYGILSRSTSYHLVKKTE